MEEKTWIVPIGWSVTGYVGVKATSAAEACRKLSDNKDSIMLPSSCYSTYISDSLVIPDFNEEDDVDTCKFITYLYDHKSHAFHLIKEL